MIDLHTHSTCSDGSDPPERVVELAARAGLHTVSLTDHDGLEGIAAARAAAAEHGIGFVPGCEVSCRFSPGTLHLLCYFVEPGSGPLDVLLASMRHEREQRNVRLLARLAELGMPLEADEVSREAGGTTLGRPHVAAALVRRGYVGSLQQAFDDLLAKGRPAYVPKALATAAETIEAATGSGGLVVMAHPFSTELDRGGLERTVAELVEAGLAGLECYYGRYRSDERAGLAELAARHGLVATGGSDYHGTFKPDLAVGVGLGDLAVPDSVLDELEKRRSG